MIIECHDSEVESPGGTLFGRAGTGGSIEYPYQAEMWVQEMLTAATCRVYVHDHTLGYVYAVWSRDQNGTLHYVAKAKDWLGEWQLPFLTEARLISTAILGDESHCEIRTLDEGAQWAAEQLLDPTIATAIVVDKDGVLAAWEKNKNGPVLVAKGPRPLPPPATL